MFLKSYNNMQKVKCYNHDIINRHEQLKISYKNYKKNIDSVNNLLIKKTHNS